jgi:hypothetical protein
MSIVRRFHPGFRPNFPAAGLTWEITPLLHMSAESPIRALERETVPAAIPSFCNISSAAMPALSLPFCFLPPSSACFSPIALGWASFCWRLGHAPTVDHRFPHHRGRRRSKWLIRARPKRIVHSRES